MAGTPSNDLNISQPGVVVFDGISTFLGRTITGGAGVTVTNGSGISGNPVISLTGGFPAVEHLTGTTGGQLNPDGSNNFNLLAGTVASGTTPVAINGSGSTLTTNIQRSQALASADATKIGLSNFDSARFSVDANGFVTTSGTGVTQTLTGNTGGAISPTSGNFNIVTANSTPIFAGSGSTLTLDFGLTNLVLGTKPAGITTANENVGVGLGSLSSLTSGTDNSCLGWSAGASLSSGIGNTIFGSAAGGNLNSSNFNVALGVNALQLANSITCTSNVSIGYTSLRQVTTGAFNIGIGRGSGQNYTSTESSNITISNDGVVGESNVIRIGTQGTSGGQQSSAFMAGITGVTVSGTAPIGVDTNGQFSSLGFGSSTQVLTSNGSSNSPTWQAATVVAITWNDVSGAFSPLKNNGYFATATANGTLPASPAQGDTIKFFVDTTQILTLTAPGSQIIRFGSLVSSAGGTFVSTLRGDSVELTYRSSDTCWCAIAGFSGTWTFT